MPSMDAPQHYERSIGIMGSEFDPFFRYVDSDFYLAETGNVESPLGWVGLLKVDEAVAESMKEYDWPIDVPDEGWYLVRIDDRGIVFGITYGGDATLPEENARADFAEAERTYAEWSELDEGYEPEDSEF